MIKDAIFTLSQGIDLGITWTEEVMAEIMSDRTTSAQIAAFLIALKMKGEGVEEIIGQRNIEQGCSHPDKKKGPGGFMRNRRGWQLHL